MLDRAFAGSACHPVDLEDDHVTHRRGLRHGAPPGQEAGTPARIRGQEDDQDGNDPEHEALSIAGSSARAGAVRAARALVLWPVCEVEAGAEHQYCQPEEPGSKRSQGSRDAQGAQTEGA